MNAGKKDATPRTVPSDSSVNGLGDRQLAHFDQEYIDDVEWGILRPGLDEQLKHRASFRFLDVGGGNGRFADRILGAYSNANGVVLDNSALLLSKNALHPRKSLRQASATDLTRLFGDERFDLISLNLVLHHMVTHRYSTTRALQASVLGQAAALLAPRGVISITEDVYVSIAAQALPGRLIYELTSSERLAPVTARLGANTAGVGVCFLSPQQVIADAASCGLTLLRYQPGPRKRVSNLRRAALFVRATHHGHFLFGAGEKATARREEE